MEIIQISKTAQLAKSDQLQTNLLPLSETPVALSPDLGTAERAIVHANRCFPKANECKKENFLSELNILITKAFVDCGQNIKDGGVDVAETTFTVFDDILRDFPSLTIPEIKIAFHKGIREPYPYGEFTGLSAVVFYKFLNGYFWHTRKEATIKQRKFEAEQEELAKKWKPSTDEEKIIKYFAINGLVKSLYAKENFTLDAAGYTYQVLLDLGYLSAQTTTEYRQQIYAQAQINLIDKINKDIKATRNPSAKAALRADLVEIQKAQESETGNKAIIAESRAIHVKKCLQPFLKGKQAKDVMLEVRHKLIGKITDDELIWEAWRLRIKKANELFKNKKQHDDFLARTKQLREQKPPRP